MPTVVDTPHKAAVHYSSDNHNKKHHEVRDEAGTGILLLYIDLFMGNEVDSEKMLQYIYI